ncbi:hypothetical protein K438DRAFT_1981548 [Mycena galopus ATCC 62051]|nr:hypothetical protein K438DRAFT_1981532 [Mycena galopus ATCC 62051]KAF8172380.1 hypothetical protein K438DRAFT_1981548 [Mycena galopus ATCC 62051]
MASPVTRLGRCPHNPDPSTTNESKRQLLTPGNTLDPIRPRTSFLALDGDGNKENGLSFNTDGGDAIESPTRVRQCMSYICVPSEAIAHGRAPQRCRDAHQHLLHIVPATPTAEIAQLSLVTPPTPPNYSSKLGKWFTTRLIHIDHHLVAKRDSGCHRAG